jgi:hypothetical protein
MTDRQIVKLISDTSMRIDEIYTLKDQVPQSDYQAMIEASLLSLIQSIKVGDQVCR